MDTININASNNKGEEDKKKKSKFGGKASASAASGIAGAVIGAAGMAYAEQNTEDLDPIPEPIGVNSDDDGQNLTAGDQPVAEETVYINPDDVMIDDDIAAYISEVEVIVDDIMGPRDNEIADLPYTEIEEIVMEPAEEITIDETLIAQEEDSITTGDLTEAISLADNGLNDTDIDIQSDLMA